MSSAVRRVYRLIWFWLLLAGCASRSTEPAMRMDPGMMERHMAPIPEAYGGLSNPVPAEARSVARGAEIYQANCATCHGESGWGDGPAAPNLFPAPAQLAHTAPMLSDTYLFYRISEGGGFAPFNSAMPAWQDTLSERDRWDVINYIRTMGATSGGTKMACCGSMGMGGMMLPMMLVGGLLLLGLVVVAGLAVVWAVRRARPQNETPLDMLKQRFARGELTAEQFAQMRQQLDER